MAIAEVPRQPSLRDMQPSYQPNEIDSAVVSEVQRLLTGRQRVAKSLARKTHISAQNARLGKV